MLPRRSGAPPRFLLFRSPETWAIPSRLLFYNLFLGFLPLFGAIAGFAIWGGAAIQTLLDPLDPIHRLTHPLLAEEAARGARRVSGMITGGDLCLVTHHHEDRNSTEDWQRTSGAGASLTVDRVEGSGGKGAPEPGGSFPVEWTSADWEPRPWLHASSAARAQRWRSLLAMPSGGRVFEGCLHPGDRLFVDVTPPGLRPTFALGPSLAPTVLTPGDGTARPRVAELSASRAGHVSMLAYAVLLSLFYLWRVFGARPVAASLIQRLLQPLLPAVTPPALLLLACSPLGLAAGFFLSGNLLEHDGAAAVARWGWLGAHFATLMSLILAIRMRDRRLALGAAIDLVRRSPRPAFDRAREGEAVSVDATVDPAAPLSPGLLTGKPRAHWAVRVTRVFKANRNHTSEPAPGRDGPLLVPVTGEGGAALLDLSQVVADVRASRRVAGAFALRRGKYTAVVGHAWPAGSRFVIEERFLDAGEPVHVIGRVLRFAPAPGRAGNMPVLGGTAAEPLILHAGSRRSLLRGLSIERAFLAAAIPLGLAVTAGLLSLSGYLVSR